MMKENSKKPLGLLTEFWSLLRYHYVHNEENAHRNLNRWRNFKSRVLEPHYPDQRKDLRILDLGCGKMYPFSYISRRNGFNVMGLDAQYVSESPLKYFGIARKNGLKVASKTFVRDMLFCRSFRAILNEACDAGRKNWGSAQFICGFAEELPYEDNYFDIVYSNDVFEHIMHVPKALAECVRVVKLDGIIYIRVHLFSSLSGSHHPKWFHPDTDPPDDIEPWFHLHEVRLDDLFRLDYGLNRLRLAEFREIFAKMTDVIEEFTDLKEGRAFLNDKERAELCDYSEEELLTSRVAFMARKKQEFLY